VAAPVVAVERTRCRRAPGTPPRAAQVSGSAYARHVRRAVSGATSPAARGNAGTLPRRRATARANARYKPAKRRQRSARTRTRAKT